MAQERVQVSTAAVGVAVLSLSVAAGYAVGGVRLRGDSHQGVLEAAPQTPISMAPLEQKMLGGTLEPGDAFVMAELTLASHSSGAAVLELLVVNQSELDGAAVTSVELQDGQSEPVRPTVLDDAPWPISGGESVATEVPFDSLPDGAYKIEALVSMVDEAGEIHGSLAETYLLVAQGVVSDVSFAEWLPYVNISQAVLDPNDPDPEAGEEG